MITKTAQKRPHDTGIKRLKFEVPTVLLQNLPTNEQMHQMSKDTR